MNKDIKDRRVQLTVVVHGEDVVEDVAIAATDDGGSNVALHCSVR